MWKDRIIGLEKHKAGDLLNHPMQWKIHPDHQRNVVSGILGEVGKVDVILAYHSERAGGALVKIDGHLRTALDPNEEWSVVVLDLTDEDADYILAVHDRTASMSATDGDKLAELLAAVNTEEEAVGNLLKEMSLEAEQTALKPAGGSGSSDRNLGDTKKQIKPVLYAEDVSVFEAAIKATGIKNRGEAVIAICRYYLEAVGEAKGQFDPALKSLIEA
jgi:hypothetical protein